jgi:hypothetical protein
MTVSDAPGTLKRFRRTPWRFQKTFLTPLKDLQAFVASIFSAHELLQAGCATIDQVVFDPKHLSALLAKHSLPAQFGRDWSLSASGRDEAAELLEAALGDWIDFIFVPTPKPFAIYADHDEYTTCHRSLQNQPAGVESKPATPRCSIHIRFLNASKGLFNDLKPVLPKESIPPTSPFQ